MYGIPDFVRIIKGDDQNYATQRNGNRFLLDDICVTIDENEALDITVEAKTSAIRFVCLRYNRTWEKGTLFYGDEFERSYGKLCWGTMNPERIFTWYFVASSPDKMEAFGAKTAPDSIVFFTADAEGVSVWLDVRSGGTAVELCGRALKAASLVFMGKSGGRGDVFGFMHLFCRKMCSDPIFPEKPVYGSNNWYYAYGDSSEKQILEDSKILARLTKGLENRPFMVIDDCWQQLARTGSAMGRPITCGNELFPDMKGLADKIRAMDLRPGIWFRPLKSSEMFLDRALFSPVNPEALDPSKDEVLELIAEDTRRLTGEWGYELIKFDFAVRDTLNTYVNTARNLLSLDERTFSDIHRTSAEIIKKFYDTIYKNAGNALIIGCNVSGHLAAGKIHMHRSGDDTSGEHYDRSVVFGVNALAFRLHQHKAFFDVDADCVCVTKAIPWEKNKDFIDAYARSSTPFFASIAPDALTPEIEETLAAAFKEASKQDKYFEPLDWFETTIPEEYLSDGKVVKYKWMQDFGKSYPYT